LVRTIVVPQPSPSATCEIIRCRRTAAQGKNRQRQIAQIFFIADPPIILCCSTLACPVTQVCPPTPDAPNWAGPGPES
jgi:hypothetical protein